MYVDRLLEEKKRLNLSARTISDTSSLHLSEDTVNRILTKKTTDPGVKTLESVAETLGMKLYELFMDSSTAARFRAFLEIENTGNDCEAQRIKLVAECEELQKTNAGLADRLRVLEVENAHQKEKIKLIEDKLALSEELLDIYRPKKARRNF